MNVKNNRRRQETRERIERVFINHLQEKELPQITVSEIVKAANINRSTFYANYEDVYALADALRTRLEQEVAGLFGNDISNIYNADDYLRLFCHIRDNQLFYTTYFKLGYDYEHTVNLYQLRQKSSMLDDPYLEYHVDFFKAGFNAIVKKWLQGGCAESPQVMSDILKREYAGRE